MYAQVEKSKENKNRAVANSFAQKKSNVKQGFGFADNRTVQRRVLKAHGPRVDDSKPYDQVNINVMMPQQVEVERAADILNKKTGQNIDNFNKIQKLYSTDEKEGEEHIIGHGDAKNIAARPNDQFQRELKEKTDSGKDYLLYIYSCFAAPGLKQIMKNLQKERNFEMHGPEQLALLKMDKGMQPLDATLKDYKVGGKQVMYNNQQFDAAWKSMGASLKVYLESLIKDENALNILWGKEEAPSKKKTNAAKQKVEDANKDLKAAIQKEADPRAYVNALRAVGVKHAANFTDIANWQDKYKGELFAMSDLITNTNIKQTNGESALARIGKVDRVKKPELKYIVEEEEKMQEDQVNSIAPEISLERVVNIEGGQLSENEGQEDIRSVQNDVVEDVEDDQELSYDGGEVAHEEELVLQDQLNPQPVPREKKKIKKKKIKKKKTIVSKNTLLGTLIPAHLRAKLKTPELQKRYDILVNNLKNDVYGDAKQEHVTEYKALMKYA